MSDNLQASNPESDSLHSNPDQLSGIDFWLIWCDLLEQARSLEDVCAALAMAGRFRRVELSWENQQASFGLAMSEPGFFCELGPGSRAGLWPAPPASETLAKVLYQGLRIWSQRRKREAQADQQQRDLARALTHLRQSQEKLLESEKMAALGQLVRGIAHELNTPLGVAQTAISLIGQDLAVDALLTAAQRADARESVGLLQKQLDKLCQLVARFKQISVDQWGETSRSFELAEYLEDIVASLRPELDQAHVHCRLSCPPDLQLHSYPGAWARVLMQLIQNAVLHAWSHQPARTDESREIRLEVEVVTARPVEGIQALISLMDRRLAQAERENAGPARAERVLLLRLGDNGGGILPALQPKLFSPFVTRDPSRFTGLGLHIVYNLVTQSLGGQIDRLPASQGTCFELRLPLP